MSEPSHNAQQCAIHMKWGFLPVVMVRKSTPGNYPGDWEWGRWRLARLGEIVLLNAMLMKGWRE